MLELQNDYIYKLVIDNSYLFSLVMLVSTKK